MKRLRIREGITAFNAAAREQGRKKMTLGRLAKLVFKNEGVSQATGLKYLSQWDTGSNLGRIEEKHLDRLRKEIPQSSDIVETAPVETTGVEQAG